MGDIVNFKSKLKAVNTAIVEAKPDFGKMSYEQKAHLLCELGQLLDEIEKIKTEIEDTEEEVEFHNPS